MASHIPVVKELWRGFGLSMKEAEPVFDSILANLKSIIDKAGLVEKGIINAFDSVGLQNNINAKRKEEPP